MLRLYWPQLAFLVTFLCSTLDQCLAGLPPGDRSLYVFRGDSRSPNQIEADGGFLPWPEIDYNDPRGYSLWDHVNAQSPHSAYISTSRSFGQSAVNFANAQGFGNYVYRIHITPNMIDVNNVFPNGPYTFQNEVSALGGIPWNAVQGWLQMPGEDSDSGVFDLDAPRFDNDLADNYTMRYETDFESRFINNPGYVTEGREGTTVRTLDDEDVATLRGGTPSERKVIIEAAERFMNRNGRMVGWTTNQRFPLWRPQTGSVQASPPHTDGHAANTSNRKMDCPSSSSSKSQTTDQVFELDEADLMDIEEFLADQESKCEENSNAGNGPLRAEASAAMARAAERVEQSCQAHHEEDAWLQAALEHLREPSSNCHLFNKCGLGLGHFKRKRSADRGPSRIRRVCEKLKKSLTTQNKDKVLVCWDGNSNESCQDGSRYRYDAERKGRNVEVVDRIELLSTSAVPVCNSISRLKVEFHLSDRTWAGTYDALLLQFEGQTTHTPIPLTNAPRAGDSVFKDIDLKTIFGANKVPLREIKSVRLLDVPNPNEYWAKDQWRLKGLSLQGICDPSGKAIQMTKFTSLEKPLQHGVGYDADLIWSGKISPRDWSAKGQRRVKKGKNGGRRRCRSCRTY